LTCDGIAGVNTRAKMKQSDARNWSMYPHFKKQEFACKDKCGFMDENLKVVEILEEIRSHFGNKPVIITSGCRCVKRNNKVGGIKRKQTFIWRSGRLLFKRRKHTRLAKLYNKINARRQNQIYIY
jgi:hypothetical protein